MKFIPSTSSIPVRLTLLIIAHKVPLLWGGQESSTKTSPAPTTIAERVGEAPGAITGRALNPVTGQYLNNARVRVLGTTIVTFTDELGVYQLPRVPAGTVTLEVFYTGLDPARVTVQVSSNQSVEKDVELTSASRYGVNEGVTQLDPFVVASARETDAETIAVNEQRFSPNIKTVVAADALGDVMDGNVGEFLKFLPGITAEYDSEAGGTVAGVSVRGIGSDMTTVSTDGVQMANTANALGDSRSFQFSQVSMNNVSRIEVTKVPTPATPADSLAGSVNMISKSAFERKGAQLRYSLSLSANHRAIDLEKTPHTSDRKVHKIRPSVSFDYTLPINKNLGIVLTGLSTHRYLQQHQIRKTYNATGTATGASLAVPFLNTFRYIDQPRINERNSAGLKVDWRISSTSVLSVALQVSDYASDITANEILFGVGTNANPTPATGVRMSYGDDFTNGAAGRGSVSMMGAASVNHMLTTTGANLRYVFDDGTWKLETRINGSESHGGYRDSADGHFRQLGITLATPFRVTYADVGSVYPKIIQAFDNNNQEIDLTRLENYRLTTAASSPRKISDEMLGGSIDLRRRIDGFSIPISLQTGVLYRQHTRDIRRNTINYTYNGLDGNPATQESPAPYANSVFVNQPNPYGFGNYVFPSVYKAWDALQKNPALFSITPAQAVGNESNRITLSQFIRESVTALYVQAEARFFRDRLNVLTGVRYERTDSLGRGPLHDPDGVYARATDGSFLRDARGDRIRKTEAGAVGSLEELRVTRFERGAEASRRYDGYFPSVHLTYSARENLLVRGAYAQTYGRPNFTNIIPNSMIDESDSDDEIDANAPGGTLTIRNSGLRPWSADNYDLSLEYYTQGGGVFSAGVFLKDIKDFFGSGVRIATRQDLAELGLDPRYEGWELRTQFNSGDARVTGVEINLQHSLQRLGKWGRFFTAFANGTKLKLEGEQQASFSSFVPESLNWGIMYSRKPITFRAKWNYRGLQKLTFLAAAGPDGYEYEKGRTTLDANLDVQLSKRFVLYANAQNLFNVSRTLLRYGSETPDYAKTYLTFDNGMQLTLGIKGTF